MNIKQVARLLNQIGVPTIVNDTSISPVVDQGVNYYKLIFNKDHEKWEFLYVPRERRSSGGEEVRKTFPDEASASKYYYLTELHSYFWRNYIYPFILDNRDINMDDTNITLENLKEAFRRLNMNEKYYSFDEKGKEYSMFFEEINKEESKVYFLGKNGKEVTATLVLENWLAYSAMYRLVYFLSLFDQHYTKLIKSKEIGRIFTDEDYITVFYGVEIESTD